MPSQLAAAVRCSGAKRGAADTPTLPADVSPDGGWKTAPLQEQLQPTPVQPPQGPGACLVVATLMRPDCTLDSRYASEITFLMLRVVRWNTHTRTHTHTHTHTHRHTYTRAHTHTHRGTHTRTSAHAHTHITVYCRRSRAPSVSLCCVTQARGVWLQVFVWQHNMIISRPWQPFVEDATVRY